MRFRVSGFDRPEGAPTGVSDGFTLEIEAESASAAIELARQARYAAGREHVHIYPNQAEPIE